MLNVKTIAEVSTLIRERFGKKRMGTEHLPFEKALNRVLAEDVLAAEFVPDFNRSTVDGYAVIASDIFGCSDAIPALLTLSAELNMGEHTDLVLEKGHCAYVPTGGELPANADAVVMLEFTEDYGDGTIAVYKPSAPGTNMIFRGDDVKPGDRLFAAGKLLSAADIGALAAMGITAIPLMKRPLVGIISTGDELLPADQPLTIGKIRDVNAPMLEAAAARAGVESRFYGIIEDDREAIRDAMLRAIEECDMLLISGGTSVGLKDAIPELISELGELIVHGVAAKPGKPTIFGAIQDKPVFGLPGNPVAAFFMFHILVGPLLYSLLGTERKDKKVTGPISRAVSSNHGREEYIPAFMKEGVIYPIASKSGLITTLAGAHGFIRIERDCEGLKQGEIVELTLFER